MTKWQIYSNVCANVMIRSWKASQVVYVKCMIELGWEYSDTGTRICSEKFSVNGPCALFSLAMFVNLIGHLEFNLFVVYFTVYDDVFSYRQCIIISHTVCITFWYQLSWNKWSKTKYVEIHNGNWSWAIENYELLQYWKN